MAISAEHRSKFAALHRQCWHIQMGEKFSSGMKNSKQTNKPQIQTKITTDASVLLQGVFKWKKDCYFSIGGLNSIA